MFFLLPLFLLKEFETCVKANHEHNDGGQINSDSERDEQTTNRPMVIDHDVDGDHRDDEGACFLPWTFWAVDRSQFEISLCAELLFEEKKKVENMWNIKVEKMSKKEEKVENKWNKSRRRWKTYET